MPLNEDIASEVADTLRPLGYLERLQLLRHVRDSCKPESVAYFIDIARALPTSKGGILQIDIDQILSE